MQDQYTAPGFTRSLDVALPRHFLDILHSLTGAEVKVLLCVFSDQAPWFSPVPAQAVADRLREPLDEVTRILEHLVAEGWVRVAEEGFTIRWDFPADYPIRMETDEHIFEPEPAPGWEDSREEFQRIRNRVAKEVFARDGHRCRSCGSTESLTVDHIIPLYGGGKNQDSNYQTLCQRCNSRKGTKSA